MGQSLGVIARVTVTTLGAAFGEKPHPNPSPEEEGLKGFTSAGSPLSRQPSNQGPDIATEQTVLRR